VIIRPATVCGYSPRQRLDLTVNILTSLAVNQRRITIFGGAQKRPNIHIEDISDLYVELLDMPDDMIAGKTFNAAYQNHTVAQLGEMVRSIVSREMPELGPIALETVPSNDTRSYHVSSEKIKRELGWSPQRTIEDAVIDLCPFRAGRIPDPLTDIRHYNVKTIQAWASRAMPRAVVTGGAASSAATWSICWSTAATRSW
jgi:nucleoside-diphosphate-sugar epimerase